MGILCRHRANWRDRASKPELEKSRFILARYCLAYGPAQSYLQWWAARETRKGGRFFSVGFRIPAMARHPFVERGVASVNPEKESPCLPFAIKRGRCISPLIFP